MAARVLMVLVAVFWMVGCGTAQPKHSAVYQQHVEQLVSRFTSGTEGDLAMQAKHAGYDFGTVYAGALKGDGDALHDLFVIGSFVDGAASESYLPCVGSVLRLLGDERFGDRLAAEPPKVRQAVIELLGYDLAESLEPSEAQLSNIYSLYPITFQHARLQATR